MDLAAGAAREGRETQARPPWELTDLISVDTLQSIEDTFARAFGLPTVILDSEGRDATTITHRVTFCEDLTSTSPVAGALQRARPVRNAGGRRRVAPRHLQGCR
jgi:ligand-binding sensor protein